MWCVLLGHQKFTACQLLTNAEYLDEMMAQLELTYSSGHVTSCEPGSYCVVKYYDNQESFQVVASGSGNTSFITSATFCASIHSIAAL